MVAFLYSYLTQWVLGKWATDRRQFVFFGLSRCVRMSSCLSRFLAQCVTFCWFACHSVRRSVKLYHLQVNFTSPRSSVGFRLLVGDASFSVRKYKQGSTSFRFSLCVFASLRQCARVPQYSASSIIDQSKPSRKWLPERQFSVWTAAWIFVDTVVSRENKTLYWSVCLSICPLVFWMAMRKRS